MTWFLNLRAYGDGGGVADQVSVLQGNANGSSIVDPAAPGGLFDAIRGKDLLFGTHGFNVSQHSGIKELSQWEGVLSLGPNALFVGVLWPGDSFWLPFLDYPVEGNEAMGAGQLLAPFINANFAAAASLSFSSHSLGARMVLETIKGLQRSPRRVMIMAGAIDADCLTTEYAQAAASIEQISVLASRKDWVLEFAFPVGNPVASVITPGHPYYRVALGREGPVTLPDPDNVQAGWQIPDSWDYGHLDYLGASGSAYTKPVNGPPPEPPQAPDIPCSDPNWSAAFVSNRFK